MSNEFDGPSEREDADDTASAVAGAMQRITDTSHAMIAVKHGQLDSAAVAARDELASAVGAARDLGVSWQTIGDALGMRRGAAYQRFRLRPPSRNIDIHEAPIDGVTVLAVRGELDAHTVPRMTDAIDKALVEVPMGLILDLAELRFLSSAGMTALVEGDRSARRSGKRFGVVADGSATRRPLETMGIDRMLNLYPTVHAAMNGLHRLVDHGEAGHR
jgi:anti-sigma B factor antagonist